MIKSDLTDVVVEANINNYTQGRRGYNICKITPHHMAGVLSAESCGNIFQNPNRQASSNYGIGNDGKIACYVGEENRAFTSSNRANDCQAITIEVSNSERGGQWTVSEAAWNSLVKLCVDICKRYNFRLDYDGTPNGSLTRHNMFANTNCPGPYLESKFPELAKEVNAQLDGNNTSGISEPSAERKTDEEIANEVIAGKWGNGEDRKNRITNAGYDYSTIQSIVNQKLGAKPVSNKKSNEVIADEVIKGKWGNGTDRKNRLQAAGYNYSEVQSIVNRKLR